MKQNPWYLTHSDFSAGDLISLSSGDMNSIVGSSSSSGSSSGSGSGSGSSGSSGVSQNGALGFLAGLFSSNAKYNPGVADASIKLITLRDQALLSGDFSTAKALNQAVKAADDQYDNIKDESVTLNGHRLSNIRIMDDQNKTVGLDAGSNTNPTTWWSEASRDGWAPVSITDASQKVNLNSKNSTILVKSQPQSTTGMPTLSAPANQASMFPNLTNNPQNQTLLYVIIAIVVIGIIVMVTRH